MTRYLLSLLLFVSSTPAFAQTDVVAQAKADLQAHGVDLSGACGAVKITNLAAWRLRPQYGLLHKAGGNRAILKADGSCLTGEQSSDPEGYATDYVIDRATGFGFDLLGDGGGANNPQWAGPEDAPDMVSRNWANFREPLDPAGYMPTSGPIIPTPGPFPGPPPPAPQPVPQPPIVVVPSTDLSPVLNALAVNHALLVELQRQMQAGFEDTRRDIAEFRAAVRSKWAAFVSSPFVKYGAAVLAGMLAKWKM